MRPGTAELTEEAEQHRRLPPPQSACAGNRESPTRPAAGLTDLYYNLRSGRSCCACGAVHQSGSNATRCTKTFPFVSFPSPQADPRPPLSKYERVRPPAAPCPSRTLPPTPLEACGNARRIVGGRGERTTTMRARAQNWRHERDSRRPENATRLCGPAQPVDRPPPPPPPSPPCPPPPPPLPLAPSFSLRRQRRRVDRLLKPPPPH